MKYFLFIFSFIMLNAFNVEYIKTYKQYVVPKKEAIKIITKKDGLTFPFSFIKTKDGYIIYGNFDKINMWLENNFYAPDDAKFETVKFTVINFDKIQYHIINKTKHVYKSCKIKKIIFLTPDEDKIITKPTNIVLKYKIHLNCK